MARVFDCMALLLALDLMTPSLAHTSTVSPNALSSEVTSRNSSARLLSLFTVVRFRNDACTSSSDPNDSGTCYGKHECVWGGGSLEGTCANGFGSCCVTKIGCDGVSALNCTYIQSPNYPNTFNYATTCKHRIRLINDNVCQLRLDVTDVLLSAPDDKGNCNDDKLTFSQDTKWSQVCGTTLNTHYYLDVDYDTAPYVDFDFDIGPGNFDRRWRIKVSQICCDQESMAPSGCGQYFTSSSGTIKAWNSDGDPGMYLNGQNYASCIRKDVNICSTTYQQANNQDNWFLPSCGDTIEYPFATTATNGAFSCSDTQITSTEPLTVSHQGPHVIYLVTQDGDNQQDDGNRENFNLNLAFQQNSC